MSDISRITDYLRHAVDACDWQDTIAFRNRLIHGYASVNFSIVWDTVRDDLPRLRSQLQAIAEEVDPKA
jgi:uncharacterized protein with HEPN domain